MHCTFFLLFFFLQCGLFFPHHSYNSHRTMGIITEIYTTESELSSNRAECLRIRYFLCDFIFKKIYNLASQAMQRQKVLNVFFLQISCRKGQQSYMLAAECDKRRNTLTQYLYPNQTRMLLSPPIIMHIQIVSI